MQSADQALILQRKLAAGLGASNAIAASIAAGLAHRVEPLEQCLPVLASLSCSAGGRLGSSQPFLGQTFSDIEDIHYDIRQKSSTHSLQQLEVSMAVAQLNPTK